ncbi:NAD(P)/FAD-dependent oxidoreductase [Roseovarius nanhaiticus]|uniref:NAD(P)/FAD-dependent oxidoreductase n=1 Tax=Roseovarius nanhaiticus TaxID=573024 RepID=UPI002492278E|nr:FAD/NAD(P)-binding oxidoreductase [Roseovarius nanhaiticus]
MTHADIIIIGAGPAGMTAARIAAEGGLQVLLLDEQPRAGGQIFRDAAQNGDRRAWLGQEYRAGAALALALDHPHIDHRPGARVWRIEAGPRVVWSNGEASQVAAAPHVLIASGAQERPVPFPGWTLPGVMTAGAAQILMKTSGMLPRRAVLAGSGPLLYLVAAQMIAAGCPPLALVETQSLPMLLRAAPHLPKALFGAKTLVKGLGLLARIRAAGVPRHTGASNFCASEDQDGRIAFRFQAKARAQRIACDLLLTHQGVIPSTHISRSAGIDHAWSRAQVAFQPVCDDWGRTGRDGLYVAGDGAGIGGADAAAAAGEMAVLDILRNSGRISEDARDQRSAPARAALFRARAIRPFLDAVYSPPAEILSPPDETIVCRCEELSAGAIRQGIAEGAGGPRQIKTALRAGMGPCQGRMCEGTIRGILANGDASEMARIDPPRARTPVTPVRLGELATLKTRLEHSA